MTSIDRERAVERLAAWLPDHLVGAKALTVTSMGSPTATGFSTETMMLDLSFERDKRLERQGVAVRLENSQPGLFLNANLRLQWDMIRAMAATGQAPVPPPVGFEGDRSVIGVAFSVVGKMSGRAVPQVPNYNTAGWVYDLDPHERARLWRNGIRVLASIHRVDWRRGFEFLDQPALGEPGLDQMLRWTEDWYEWARAGRTHPLVETALRRLRQEQPADAPVNVLWGDAAPNNMLFRDDLSVSAVLDWEAAALGPGEADLAWWLFYDEYISAGFGIPRLEGLPDRNTTIEIYEEALGRPVRDMAYYELLAHTRNAILSLRSVVRQIEFGALDPGTTAVTNNPTSRLLAKRLGAPAVEVGADYAAYLAAVVGHKTKEATTS
jgi:aminoglycoside phosphotransferase (APT) family kinase protein